MPPLLSGGVGGGYGRIVVGSGSHHLGAGHSVPMQSLPPYAYQRQWLALAFIVSVTMEMEKEMETEMKLEMEMNTFGK